MSEKVLTAEELVEDNIILINEINWENMNPRLPRITIRKIINPEDALEFIRIVREVENLRMRCDCSDALKEVEVRVREETARKIKNIINNEPIGNSKFVYIGNIINKINREFLVKTEVQKE